MAREHIGGDEAHEIGPARFGGSLDLTWPRLVVLSFAWLLVNGWARAESPKESAERLKADVYYFASGTLEGRGLATPGIDLAAQHIRAEFRRIGLRSGTRDGSYLQAFEHGRTHQAAGTTLHNVIGVLEGKGSTADETIVIGAHYDHLGYGQANAPGPATPRGRIHPGADDNASGTAAMLELARRFAGRHSPPRRRMVFIAFCAEENGRAGSRHYASKEPLFPIKDTVAMVNFDMVGRLRNDELGVAGNESAREFRDILTAADARSPIKLMLGGPAYPDDSDHASFADVGVPILYICTGSHEDRHTPGDTADKINFDGLAKVVDLCEDVLDRLLVGSRPRFVPQPGRSPSQGSN
jgi:aminopeptidase N